jgi:hypothetical protein
MWRMISWRVCWRWCAFPCRVSWSEARSYGPVSYLGSKIKEQSIDQLHTIVFCHLKLCGGRDADLSEQAQGRDRYVGSMTTVETALFPPHTPILRSTLTPDRRSPLWRSHQNPPASPQVFSRFRHHQAVHRRRRYSGYRDRSDTKACTAATDKVCGGRLQWRGGGC